MAFTVTSETLTVTLHVTATCAACQRSQTVTNPQVKGPLRSLFKNLGWKYHEAHGDRAALWHCPNCVKLWLWCPGHKRFEPTSAFQPSTLKGARGWCKEFAKQRYEEQKRKRKTTK